MKDWCAMETRERLERFPHSAGLEPWAARSVGHCVTYLATRAPAEKWKPQKLHIL